MTTTNPDHPPRLRPRVGVLGLGIAAAASIGLWLAVEFVWLDRAPRYAEAALRAALAMEHAYGVLWSEKAQRGLLAPADADPNQTGMIGPEYTSITTSIGDLPAKRTTTSPAFAAALVREIDSLGLEPGAPVVIIVSGSFVGGNIAAIAAVEALGLRPVVVASVSASMWGATDPEFTWLDIEASLVRHGAIATSTNVAVLGGTGGVGREMDPAGVAAIRRAAERSDVVLLEEPSLDGLVSAVRARVQGALEGAVPGLVVNVGGAVVGLGVCPESYELPPGLRTDPVPCSTGTPGLALELAQDGAPLLHVLNIRRLALEWGIAFDPQPLPQARDSAKAAAAPRPTESYGILN